MTTALIADDEPHLAAYLQEQLAALWPELRIVHVARHGLDAARQIAALQPDLAFLDIKMPGLDGLDLARVLARFAQRPHVVFVTAYDEHAIHAFDLRATDYLLKPVRAERLAEAVRRVVHAVQTSAQMPGSPPVSPSDVEGRRAPDTADETIAVELGGVTRFVQRSQVRYVEAQGDYARLHTDTSSHLVRVPLTTLEERWASAGFVRIHRSTLVALPHVDEIRVDGGRCSVRLGDRVLQVSRRHTKDLRDRLVRAASLAR
jgi:DNA-binding LytR/AlgR family response regulator